MRHADEAGQCLGASLELAARRYTVPQDLAAPLQAAVKGALDKAMTVLVQMHDALCDAEDKADAIVLSRGALTEAMQAKLTAKTEQCAPYGSPLASTARTAHKVFRTQRDAVVMHVSMQRCDCDLYVCSMPRCSPICTHVPTRMPQPCSARHSSQIHKIQRGGGKLCRSVWP